MYVKDEFGYKIEVPIYAQNADKFWGINSNDWECKQICNGCCLPTARNCIHKNG